MTLPQIKPGFLTSEFWLTVVTFIVNIFVMLGYLTPAEADDFVKSVATAFAAISTIIITVYYIYSRIKVKTGSGETSTTSQVLPSATQSELPPSGLVEDGSGVIVQ